MGTSSGTSATNLSNVFVETIDCWVVGCDTRSHSEVRGALLLAEGCAETICAGCPLAARNFKIKNKQKQSVPCGNGSAQYEYQIYLEHTIEA